jgi:hypothetical protein
MKDKPCVGIVEDKAMAYINTHIPFNDKAEHKVWEAYIAGYKQAMEDCKNLEKPEENQDKLIEPGDLNDNDIRQYTSENY